MACRHIYIIQANIASIIGTSASFKYKLERLRVLRNVKLAKKPSISLIAWSIEKLAFLIAEILTIWRIDIKEVLGKYRKY